MRTSSRDSTHSRKRARPGSTERRAASTRSSISRRACSAATVTGAGGTLPLTFVAMLTIPGVILGWAYLRSGSLWLTLGMHFAWNFLQDEVLNLHGRGSRQLIGAVTAQSGPEWAVGTHYGVEVGLLGLLGFLLIGVGVWAWVRRLGQAQT